MTVVRVDVAIFGAGIAGLWTLARLRRAGYSALLFETRRLGGVQSIASQGIIHGGAKYALAGRLTGSSEAIRAMPGIWRDCLAGRGEIDLSPVEIRSQHQLLWTQSGIAARLTGFLSSRIMQSRMARVAASDRPEPFSDPAFGGDLYRLEEPVLNTASLLGVLADRVGPDCYRYQTSDLRVRSPGEAGQFEIGGVQIDAHRVLFTAGAGNAKLLAGWGRSRPEMQRRPLQMVIARGRLPDLNGHWLGASRQLKLTVTSTPVGEADRVWYLGGGLSEAGVGRTPAAQIEAAGVELAAALPWLRLPELHWQTLAIDRAEPLTADGSRPDEPFLDDDDGIYTAWPTKLAFAPRLAHMVLERLSAEGVRPGDRPQPPALTLPRPEPGRHPWEDGEWS